MDSREELVSRKQGWIDARRKEGVEGFYRAQAMALPLPPSLHDALLVPRAERAVIPYLNRGLLEARAGREVDITEHVRLLTELGASALMIATDSDDARGSGCIKDVLTAAQNSSVPIICHDLILDPMQITMARAHGAAAVVLSAQLFSERILRALYRSAIELSLEVVLDVASLRHIEISSRIGTRHGAGDEVRMFGADILELGDAEQLRSMERLATVLPEHVVPIASCLKDPRSGVSDLQQAGYEAFVVDASWPDLSTLSATMSSSAGAVSPLI